MRAAGAKLRKFQADTDLELFAVSPADAAAEAVSNRDNQVYFGKGAISLREGDVVLDCGANVGSFARMAAPVIGPTGTIYCLEPMPDVCTALKLNIIKYKEWADQRKLKVANVEAICAGVGDEGSQPEREFAYYPRLTAMSSMYPDEADAAQATFSLVLHRPQSFSLLEDCGKAVARSCSPQLYKLVHSLFFRALLLRPAEKVMCPMVTVSQLIRQYNIKDVGLLKINVERAEWDVLAGIQEQDWPKVRQVSAQVHDIRGRVGHLAALLRRRGFQVTVCQEPRFASCNLHMVYGCRP